MTTLPHPQRFQDAGDLIPPGELRYDLILFPVKQYPSKTPTPWAARLSNILGRFK